MILIQTGSLWGRIYRLRHFIDGKRVSDAEWRRIYEANQLNQAHGTITRQQTGFWRKEWKIA